jgi:hypothetical protein
VLAAAGIRQIGAGALQFAIDDAGAKIELLAFLLIAGGWCGYAIPNGYEKFFEHGESLS